MSGSFAEYDNPVPDRGYIPADEEQKRKNGDRYKSIEEVLADHVKEDIQESQKKGVKNPDIDYRGLIPRIV